MLVVSSGKLERLVWHTVFCAAAKSTTAAEEEWLWEVDLKIKLEKYCLGTVFTLIFFFLLDLQNASDCTDFDLGRRKNPGGHAPGPP